MQNAESARIEKRKEDFLVIVRQNNVWIIKNLFSGDIEKFINAPKEFVKFRTLTQSQKAKCCEEVYKNIDAYNSNGLSKDAMRTIFGTDSNHKLIAYAPLVAELQKSGMVYKRNHGTLIMDDKRIPFDTFYTLPKKELEEIFSDEGLVSDILDVDSGLYTKRQKRIIRKIFKGRTM